MNREEQLKRIIEYIKQQGSFDPFEMGLYGDDEVEDPNFIGKYTQESLTKEKIISAIKAQSDDYITKLYDLIGADEIYYDNGFDYFDDETNERDSKILKMLGKAFAEHQ